MIMRLRDIPRPTIALTSAAILMLALAATTTFLPNEASFPPNPVAARPAATPLAPAPSALRSDYAEIAERPLFRSTRRPPAPSPVVAPPPPPQAAPAAPPLQGYVLVGVVLSGETSVAMLRSRANALKNLRLGETLDGWSVSQILAQEVTFQNGSQEIRISFSKLPVSSTGADAGQNRANRSIAPAR